MADTESYKHFLLNGKAYLAELYKMEGCPPVIIFYEQVEAGPSGTKLNMDELIEEYKQQNRIFKEGVYHVKNDGVWTFAKFYQASMGWHLFGRENLYASEQFDEIGEMIANGPTPEVKENKYANGRYCNKNGERIEMSTLSRSGCDV